MPPLHRLWLPLNAPALATNYSRRWVLLIGQARMPAFLNQGRLLPLCRRSNRATGEGICICGRHHASPTPRSNHRASGLDRWLAVSSPATLLPIASQRSRVFIADCLRPFRSDLPNALFLCLAPDVACCLHQLSFGPLPTRFHLSTLQIASPDCDACDALVQPPRSPDALPLTSGFTMPWRPSTLCRPCLVLPTVCTTTP